MRCRGCDSLIYYTPVVWGVIQSGDGEEFVVLDDDGLCHTCIREAFSLYNYVYDHEYVFENARDGVTASVPLQE